MGSEDETATYYSYLNEKEKSLEDRQYQNHSEESKSILNLSSAGIVFVLTAAKHFKVTELSEQILLALTLSALACCILLVFRGRSLSDKSLQASLDIVGHYIATGEEKEDLHKKNMKSIERLDQWRNRTRWSFASGIALMTVFGIVTILIN